MTWLVVDKGPETDFFEIHNPDAPFGEHYQVAFLRKSYCQPTHPITEWSVELSGEAITICGMKLVVPVKKPRTVEDVKDEIAASFLVTFPPGAEWETDNYKRSQALADELRTLQAKAGA